MREYFLLVFWLLLATASAAKENSSTAETVKKVLSLDDFEQMFDLSATKSDGLYRLSVLGEYFERLDGFCAENYGEFSVRIRVGDDSVDGDLCRYNKQTGSIRTVQVLGGVDKVIVESVHGSIPFFKTTKQQVFDMKRGKSVKIIDNNYKVEVVSMAVEKSFAKRQRSLKIRVDEKYNKGYHPCDLGKTLVYKVTFSGESFKKKQTRDWNRCANDEFEYTFENLALFGQPANVFFSKNAGKFRVTVKQDEFFPEEYVFDVTLLKNGDYFVYRMFNDAPKVTMSMDYGEDNEFGIDDDIAGTIDDFKEVRKFAVGERNVFDYFKFYSSEIRSVSKFFALDIESNERMEGRVMSGGRIVFESDARLWGEYLVFLERNGNMMEIGKFKLQIPNFEYFHGNNLKVVESDFMDGVFEGDFFKFPVLTTTSGEAVKFEVKVTWKEMQATKWYSLWNKDIVDREEIVTKFKDNKYQVPFEIPSASDVTIQIMTGGVKLTRPIRVYCVSCYLKTIFHKENQFYQEQYIDIPTEKGLKEIMDRRKIKVIAKYGDEKVEFETREESVVLKALPKANSVTLALSQRGYMNEIVVPLKKIDLNIYYKYRNMMMKTETTDVLPCGVIKGDTFYVHMKDKLAFSVTEYLKNGKERSKRYKKDQNEIMFETTKDHEKYKIQVDKLPGVSIEVAVNSLKFEHFEFLENYSSGSTFNAKKSFKYNKCSMLDDVKVKNANLEKGYHKVVLKKNGEEISRFVSVGLEQDDVYVMVNDQLVDARQVGLFSHDEIYTRAHSIVYNEMEYDRNVASYEAWTLPRFVSGQSKIRIGRREYQFNDYQLTLLRKTGSELIIYEKEKLAVKISYSPTLRKIVDRRLSFYSVKEGIVNAKSVSNNTVIELKTFADYFYVDNLSKGDWIVRVNGFKGKEFKLKVLPVKFKHIELVHAQSNKRVDKFIMGEYYRVNSFELDCVECVEKSGDYVLNLHTGKQVNRVEPFAYNGDDEIVTIHHNLYSEAKVSIPVITDMKKLSDEIKLKGLDDIYYGSIVHIPVDSTSIPLSLISIKLNNKSLERNYKDRVVVKNEKEGDQVKSDDKGDEKSDEKKDQVKKDEKKETVPKDKLPDTILNTDCFYTTETIPVGEHDLAVAIKIGDSIKSFTVKIKVKEPKKIELANLSGFAGDTLTLPTIDELILKENIKYLIDGKEFTNSFTLPENKSSVNIKIKNGKYVIYETDFSYEKVTRFEPQILNKQKFYLASSILKVSLPSSFCNGKSNILGNWIISPFYQSQKVNLCESFDLILPYNLKADGLNDLNLQYKYNNLYSSNYKIQVFKPTLNVSLSSENNNKISKIYRNQRIKIQFESNLCIHSKSINSIMNVIGVDGREDSLHFDICSKQLFYTVPSSWPSSLIDFDFMFEYAPHNKFKLSKIDYSNNSRDINQDTTSETSESSETTVVNSDPEVSRKQGSRRSTRASSTSTSSTSSTKSSSRTSLSSRRFATKKSSTRKSSTSRKSSTKKSLAKSLSAGSSTKKTSATSSNANSKATGSEHDSDFVTVTTENTLTQVAALANKAPFNDIAQVKSVIKKNKQSNESKENNTVLYASLGAAAGLIGLGAAIAVKKKRNY